MRDSTAGRTSGRLFSTRYLDEGFRETAAWERPTESELRSVRERIGAVWERERPVEAETEAGSLVRSVARELGFVVAAVPDGAADSHPDYALFGTEAAAREARRRGEYEEALAVVVTTRGGRPFDSRSNGGQGGVFGNPSHHTYRALDATPVRWAILTDGRRWRLYHGPTSHRLDSYHEIDLPTALDTDDPTAFGYFYRLFGREAFVEDTDGVCLLDECHERSTELREQERTTVRERSCEAVVTLAEGLLRGAGADPDSADLELVRDSALVYVYRLVCLLYADATARSDSDDRRGGQCAPPDVLSEMVAETRDESPGEPPDDLWSRLERRFRRIDDDGDAPAVSRGNSRTPAYGGDLFQTDPSAEDSAALCFLAEHRVDDTHLARVVDLLTHTGCGDRQTHVDYASLGVRHLGELHEQLLDHELCVADEPTTRSGVYVSAISGDTAGHPNTTSTTAETGPGHDTGAHGDAPAGGEGGVEAGELCLRAASGGRAATGSYYTPEYVVEHVVERTLGPLVADIRAGLEGDSHDGTVAEAFTERVLELRVLDPAMGSGYFLTSAVDYLAREIIHTQEQQAARVGAASVETGRDIDWARQQVARHCVYGVDLDPLAVELARASVWLCTLDASHPVDSQGRHLRAGNALVGVGALTGERCEDAVSLPETGEQLLRACRDRSRDDTAPDIGVSGEDGDRPERIDRLRALANVHTADRLGVAAVPDDARDRLAAALGNDTRWARVEQRDWFQRAQQAAQTAGYVHWPLAFPEVFCEETGRSDEAGFDAVLGNPPYIRSRALDTAHKRFYRTRYRTARGAYDLYVLFMELAAELGRRSSFVVPNKWTTTDYGERLRELLFEECSLRAVVDLSRLDVFPDADIYPVVVSYTDEPDEAELRVSQVDTPTELGTAAGVTVPRRLVEQLNGVVPVGLTPEFAPVVERAVDSGSPLGEHLAVTEGIHTGNVRDTLVVDEPVTEACERLADGSSIDRYHVAWSGEWVRYDESLVDSDAGEYADLRDRGLFDRAEKLLVRDISDRPVAAYDDGGLFALNTLYSATRRSGSPYGLKYLLAVFNSRVVTRFFREVYGGSHVRGDYLRFKPMFTERIPVPDPRATTLTDEQAAQIASLDAGIDTTTTVTAIAALTDCIRAATADRRGLNCRLGDHLGEYRTGERVDELPGYRPVEGATASPLGETTGSKQGLRVGSVEFTADGDRLRLSLSARYKPDRTGLAETDRWGYTETGLLPAVDLVGLSETRQLLVRAFVSHAVETGAGGFRERATKTNSLLDRLAAIQLPAVADVREDLRRYRAAVRAADRLDDRIETADALLDDIVADLYGLSGAERETIGLSAATHTE